MRYGFALEYNKYDSLHLRVEYLPALAQSKEAMRQLGMRRCIPKYKLFKIKRSKLNLDLVFFLRSQALFQKFGHRTISEALSTGQLIPVILEPYFWIRDISLEIACLN